MDPATRIGYGEDAHRLAPLRLRSARPLKLGGFLLPGAEVGTQARSDGDALLHAVADAVLASWALGDIGQHFPDGDEANEGLDSAIILRHALGLAAAVAGPARLRQVSAVVTVDRPKLNPHRQAIARSLATLLGLPEDRVGLGFKTSEGLAEHHLQVRAVVLWG